MPAVTIAAAAPAAAMPRGSGEAARRATKALGCGAMPAIAAAGLYYLHILPAYTGSIDRLPTSGPDHGAARSHRPPAHERLRPRRRPVTSPSGRARSGSRLFRGSSVSSLSEAKYGACGHDRRGSTGCGHAEKLRRGGEAARRATKAPGCAAMPAIAAVSLYYLHILPAYTGSIDRLPRAAPTTAPPGHF